MNYQSKGFQISLLIHAGIFLLIFNMSARISESRLSPPIIIDFAVLEEFKEKEPEPPPMVEAVMDEKPFEATVAPAPPKMKTISLPPKEPPKPKEKPKPVVRKESPAPKKAEEVKESPAPSAPDPQISSETISSLTGSAFSEDSPVAVPAPSGSGGNSEGVPGGTASVNPKSGSGSGYESEGSGEGDSDNLTFGTGTGPRYRHKEMPVYPYRARRLGKEGTVLLRLTIDENGHLINVEVLEDSGYGFAEAAIEAVKKSSFIPPTINGKPIRARALLPVKFTLR